ncbi:hypothetical protein ABIB35_003542 [Arthrobacter sp. UYP6]
MARETSAGQLLGDGWNDHDRAPAVPAKLLSDL